MTTVELAYAALIERYGEDALWALSARERTNLIYQEIRQLDAERASTAGGLGEVLTNDA